MKFLLPLVLFLSAIQLSAQSIDFSVAILDLNESASSFRVTNSISFGSGHLLTYGPSQGTGISGIRYFEGTESRDLFPIGQNPVLIVQKTLAGVLISRRNGQEREYYFVDTEAITPRYIGNLPNSFHSLGGGFNDQFLVMGGDDLYTTNGDFSAFVLLIEDFNTTSNRAKRYVFNAKLFLANSERIYVSDGTPEILKFT